MSNIVKNYQKILHTLLPIHEQIESSPKAGRKPKMSDIEVVALSLTAEYMSIDSENSLFKQLQGGTIDNLIERSQFNKRRRQLFGLVEKIRKVLSRYFVENEDYFIVDSMPMEICKWSRHGRVKICKDDYRTSPEKGYCASQSSWFYGYKLHGVCTVSGVFTSLEITKANVHDIAFLNEIKQQLSDCVLLGDKGYLSASWQTDLFETVNISLETPMRSNQKGYRKQPFVFRKARKRIETLFSQLCDQFMIRRNYAKSFSGFKTRVLSKITAMTTIQFLNKFEFNRNINNLKIQIT
ncbi:IS982 family transposase [Roseivirga seohaensis]|uniref:IS982 family transposase n=1 Tax=Roseivirga seohaensis TaxID=1914963 RepID=UPI003BAAE94B